MIKVIKDFPNYKIDTLGNVYNLKGLVLKPHKSSNGYLRVSLSNEVLKHKCFSIHRLVAEAFIPNPDNLPQVNHKDEDKTNNNVDNLEWCTCLENLTYSDVIGKASIAKQKRVKCVTTGELYTSIKDACKKHNLSHSNIVACCNGRRKTTGGMKWQYA